MARGRIAVPPAFVRLCEMVHQDIEFEYATPEEMIVDLIGQLNNAERVELRDFFDELLSGRYSTAEIKGVWNRTLSDYFIRPSKGAHAFTVFARSVLD